MAISHPPFRPFSHQISILKNSFPQVMLCYVFTPWEKKSENLKQSKTKWWISKWRRWQERSQGRPLSGGPSPVRQCHRAPFLSSSSVFQRQQPNYNSNTAPKQLCKNAERKADKNEHWNEFIEPAPDQMAAEMRRCCQLQASSSMHRSYPWHLFVVVFTVLSWICCFGNINWLGLVGGRCKTI